MTFTTTRVAGGPCVHTLFELGVHATLKYVTDWVEIHGGLSEEWYEYDFGKKFMYGNEPFDTFCCARFGGFCTMNSTFVGVLMIDLRVT